MKTRRKEATKRSLSVCSLRNAPVLCVPTLLLTAGSESVFRYECRCDTRASGPITEQYVFSVYHSCHVKSCLSIQYSWMWLSNKFISLWGQSLWNHFKHADCNLPSSSFIQHKDFQYNNWPLTLHLHQVTMGTGGNGCHGAGLKQEVATALRTLRDKLLAEQKEKEVKLQAPSKK